jgi:hypothetical protein
VSLVTWNLKAHPPARISSICNPRDRMASPIRHGLTVSVRVAPPAPERGFRVADLLMAGAGARREAPLAQHTRRVRRGLRWAN